VLPFVVIAGKNHLLTWDEDSPSPQDWVIIITENGWMINEIGLEWVKYFDKNTKSRTMGGYCLLILDGHESYYSAGFKLHYKEYKIIILCMPAYLSYKL
jgi:hypothetical protein